MALKSALNVTMGDQQETARVPQRLYARHLTDSIEGEEIVQTPKATRLVRET